MGDDWIVWTGMDQWSFFVCAQPMREDVTLTLKCNVLSHWLDAYAEWSPVEWSWIQCSLPNICRVCGLLCFVDVWHWSVNPGLHHWHWGSTTAPVPNWHWGSCIAPVSVKQPWRIRVNVPHESTKNWWYNHNKTKHNQTVCIFYGIYSVNCLPYMMIGISIVLMA